MIARRLGATFATFATFAIVPAIATAVVCFAAQPSAQPSTQPSSRPSEPTPGQPTFKTRAAGVRIDVLVTDEERPVANLTAKDFELTDRDVAQQVDVSRLHDLPVDVIIVLDNSTSLGDDGLNNLIHATDTLIGRLNPTDRVALVTFSQVVVLRSALTDDTAKVREMVRGLKVRGSTSVIDASFAAAMLQTEADRSALMLVFSDGVDTASWLDAERVLAAIRRAAVVPYAVVVGNEVSLTGGTPVPLGARATVRTVEPFDAAERFLRDLVVTGGGVFVHAEDTRGLERRFAEALDSFRQRYVLTYAPQGVEGSGWHPVTIKVKGHRYRVRARPATSCRNARNRLGGGARGRCL
jgi:VWFA-related protein